VVIPAIYGLVKGWPLQAKSAVAWIEMEIEPEALREAAE
jgi:hypothetical protein